MHETKGNVCRFQMTDKITEDNAVKESRFLSNSEFFIEELREWCSQDSLTTRFVLFALKCLKNEIDSATAIRSMEIGITCEEPNELELDEYMEELLDVFDSIC